MSENATNAKLFTALVKAQAETGKLLKDSINPHLRNKYASLAAVIETVRQPLTNNGLVLYQAASTYLDQPAHVIVSSSLIHGESGEMVTEHIAIPLVQITAQAIGSAITYGRRYLAMAQCGLAPDDEDDGNGASQSHHARPQPQPQPQAKQDAAWDSIPRAKPTDADLTKARKAFHAQIANTFNKDDIDSARHWMIESYTSKQTPDNPRTSTNDLSIDELVELRRTLENHKGIVLQRWDEYKENNLESIKVETAEAIPA